MKLITGLFFLLATQLVVAECGQPTAPQLPDGASSNLETMVEGQKAVKAYVAQTEAYLDCLNEEAAAAAEAETPEQQMARIDLHNQAVDDREAVASAFNEEIREYKAQGQ